MKTIFGLDISNKKGENYMKKLLTITLTVLLAGLLIVSCSPETKNVEDGLALITFSAGERETRSLTRTNPELDPEQFYWFYTATKTDGTGLMTGSTKEKTAVKDGKKGLGTVGPFSYGDWNFTLYGYIDENKESLAYSGTSALTVKSTTNTLTVTVESNQTAGVFGHLDFPAKGSIALTGGGDSEINYSSFIEEVIIKRVDGKTQDDIFLYDYVDSQGKDGLRRKDLYSGSYSITFRYWQDAALTEDNSTNKSRISGGYVVAEETIYVAIADHLTTTIGGDIASNKGEVNINVENGIVEITKAAEINTSGTTEIKVAAAPVSSTATATEEQTAAAEVATTISIPQGAITGASVEAKTTSYSREAVAATKPTFTIQEKTSTGSETTTEAVVLGGLDIDLYVDSSTKKTTDFSENSVLTITTYISKGLQQDDIVIKYDGPAGDDGEAKSDGKVVSYDPESGKLVFTVDHLSSYYFVSKSAAVLNTTKSSAHSSLSEAVKAASPGDTLTLAKDIEVKSAITLDKSLTVDLAGHTVTVDVTASGADAFTLSVSTSAYSVAFKNGTIDGKAKNNTFTLNSYSSLILDAVKVDVECLRGIQVRQGSNPASLEIRNGSSVKVTDGYYAVATNASKAESTYVSIVIDHSELKTVSTENRTEYKEDTTALLVNVPSSLLITDSKIIGERQGAIIRGADTVHTKKIIRTSIETTSEKTDYSDDLTECWKEGNGVPLAALVIGDNSSSYPFGTTVELEDVTLTNKEKTTRRSIYVYQDNDEKTTYPVKVTGSLEDGDTINSDFNVTLDIKGALVGDTYYSTLSSAITAANEGNTITLLDCSESNNLSDDDVSKYTWKVLHNNCDAESDGFWHGKNDSFAVGYGTKLEPYMVADKEQFQNITSMYDKYAYYKVTDIYSDLDLSGWCPVKLHGSFDGSNKEFKNVTSYLFQRVGYQLQNENITLKNFSATFNVSNKSQYSAGAVVKQIDNSGTTTFDSVDVHGTIEGYWNVGSYYSYGTANYDDKGSDYTATFVDCKSDATLICVSSSTIGGFVGHGYEGTGHKQTLNIDDKSEYTGTIYCAYDNSGNHYMGMNSTGTLFFNGKETSRYDDSFTKYEKRVKISVVAPQLGENGYTVQVDNNTTKIIVSVIAQLDAYQEDNTTTKSNMNGITMVLDSSEVALSASSNGILRKVISAIIDNTASEYGYSVDDSGKMTVKVPGNSNYRSGTVRLTATQYKSDGTIICTGTVDVITITNPV